MGKGELTRGRILDEAIAISSVDGLTGLTLGRLADTVGMSKSGLFAHFKSKEELQLQVLAEAVERFRERVIKRAFTAPRGEPRVRALFDRWVEWAEDPAIPGGCIMTQASVELDDMPGAPREFLAAAQRDWRALLAEAARRAMEIGHFRADLDPELFAFQMLGIALSRHQAMRLLRDPDADSKSRRAFDALVLSCRP
jgi:AcrR family transcriptional regulator